MKYGNFQLSVWHHTLHCLCRSLWNSVRRIRLKEKREVVVKSEYILSYLSRKMKKEERNPERSESSDD